MDTSSYWELGGPSDGIERTAYFVLDSLLKSRIECGFESNREHYDEDVNVYLVHLLARLVRQPGLGGFGSERDIDVFERVRDSGDPRHKSAVYRLSADNLLLATSLFTDSPYVEREGRREWDTVARDRIGRGKAYYHYAAMYQERLPAVSPAFARILALLSHDFERYVGVLFHMRGEYFNLSGRLKEEQIMALQENLQGAFPEPGGPEAVNVLRDEFLDAYWSWHQNPDEENRKRLEQTVQRLKDVDPDFGFTLPS
jgi:hypothetical protein